MTCQICSAILILQTTDFALSIVSFERRIPMKRFIAAFLTFALTLTLVTFVSAAEVPTLHPAETLKSHMSEQQIQAAIQTTKENMKENSVELHPADKLKTGLTLEEALKGYKILEVTESTGIDTFGNEFAVTSYRVEDPDDTKADNATQNARYVPCPVGPGACGTNDLLGIDIIKDTNTGKIKYFVYHYGCKKCGSVDHSEVVYK